MTVTVIVYIYQELKRIYIIENDISGIENDISGIENDISGIENDISGRSTCTIKIAQ